MDVDTDLEADDRLLKVAADGGEMDYEKWPALFERLIPRIEKIVQEAFPPIYIRPAPTLTTPPSSPPQRSPKADDAILSQDPSSHSADKENSPPTPRKQSPTDCIPSDGSLPPSMQLLLENIVSTLKTYFPQKPPHTIQRFSELILSPKTHYRTLPSYLHALDRVVHVTSSATTYPLPPAIPDALGAKVLSNGLSPESGSHTDPTSISWGNSTTTAQVQQQLGSDESLGGALLTPIAWLRNQSLPAPRHSEINSNGHITGALGVGGQELEGSTRTEHTETIDGPNGPGGVETVSVSVNGISSTMLASTTGEGGGLRAEGGVTQGELLRQEQREGVIPVTQLAGVRVPGEEEDETPHARGPDEVGVEDMGPQMGAVGVVMQGIDVEAAVGRRGGVVDNRVLEHGDHEAVEEDEEAADEDDDDGESTASKREAADEAEKPPAPKKAKRRVREVEMVDADGRTADEPKYGEHGENRGSDAIDTSSV